MPINPTLISNAEILVQGRIVAGGSNSRATSYTFHFKRTTTVNPLSKANFESIFQSTVMAKVLLASNVRWNQLFNNVRWIDDAQDQSLPISRNNLGAIATPGSQSFDAVYVLLRTALRGKNYRGSKHFFGVSEADTTQPNDDILNAGAIVLWGDVITGMMTPLVDASGNTWNLSVVSRNLSQLRVNPTTVISNVVTTALLNKRIGRMSRRTSVSVY